MARTLLVTGATGTVSGALLESLRGAGLALRALVRDPAGAAVVRERGAEAVIGDLGDPASLPPAFAGVDDLWLLVANGPLAPEHSMNAIWAARQAGVERVVRLSAIGAAHDAPTRSGRLHALSDHEVQSSGMRWTILRPHWFMQNLLADAGAIAAGTFSLNAAQGRLAMVDVRDVADLAARVLVDPPQRHAGRTYSPSGPEAVSFGDVAERLTRILGRPVGYAPISGAAQREALRGYGMPAWIADMLVEYGEAYAAGFGDGTTTDVRDVLGRAPRSVDDFLRDHARAFSA